jgi:hypothetical protein
LADSSKQSSVEFLKKSIRQVHLANRGPHRRLGGTNRCISTR